MSSKHLLDPELEPLAALASASAGELGSASSLMETLLMQPAPVSDTVETREVMIPGLDGSPPIRALLYVPKDASRLRGAMLHIHGGGYITGAPEMSAIGNLGIAEKLGAVILSVDYRLAPDTKYPGAIEDCYAALGWLHDHAGELAIASSHIIVGGESAGGGLAAALALLARDRGIYPIAYQYLIYPMIDDRTAVASDVWSYAGEFVWTRASNLYGWTALLDCPPGSDEVSCYAAAARAKDLAGLPPTFMACGALDLFIDENIVYARRLIHAGVPVEMHIYPGAPHGFQMVQEAKVAQQAAQDAIAALRRALTVAI